MQILVGVCLCENPPVPDRYICDIGWRLMQPNDGGRRLTHSHAWSNHGVKYRGSNGEYAYTNNLRIIRIIKGANKKKTRTHTPSERDTLGCWWRREEEDAAAASIYVPHSHTHLHMLINFQSHA